MSESKTRIIVVDDDARLRELLNRYLSDQGFSVRTASDANDMNRWLARERYDLMVLDLMMPGEDGLSICRRLRGLGDKMPIIMLTAKGDDVDRIVGLEVGADDYLAKPFNPRELEYRVEALLRRGGSAPPETDGERIEVGDLVIDKRRHEVIRNGSRVDLTPLEFQILELLASEPGRAWSRNALLDRVWSTDYEGYQRNIDPHINRLRKKLEADPKNPRYVLTVRGVGYKLNEIHESRCCGGLDLC